MTVEDNRPPELPGDPGQFGGDRLVRKEQWSSTQVSAATDKVDHDVMATCAPASNQVFKVGTTPVKCTATDDAGNQAERSFNVTVELLTYGPNGNPIPARESSQTRATRARK